MAAALAGCKILKEMARLESEAESARSMKEAKYEQFALGESLMTSSANQGQAGGHVSSSPWVSPSCPQSANQGAGRRSCD